MLYVVKIVQAVSEKKMLEGVIILYTYIDKWQGQIPHGDKSLIVTNRWSRY